MQDDSFILNIVDFKYFVFNKCLSEHGKSFGSIYVTAIVRRTEISFFPCPFVGQFLYFFIQSHTKCKGNH